MSMAMTVVLPEPVAIFRARRTTRISHVIGGFQVIKEALTLFAHLWRDFRQPDDGLHRLDLTKERPNSGEIIMSPVLQQSSRRRRHPPRIRVFKLPPSIHVLPQFIDNGRGIVLLILVDSPMPSSKITSVVECDHGAFSAWELA